MSYQLIDMTKDPRSGQFAYFRQMLFPFAGVTAEVDITDFAARRQGRPFFLSFLHCHEARRSIRILHGGGGSAL